MKKIITDQRLKECILDRTEQREKAFSSVADRLGSSAVDELRALYDIYDEKYYLWLASLWQSEIGGFYYSVSGRDTEGFLPDIESTVQALNSLGRLGLNSAMEEEETKARYTKMRRAIIRFAKSLEDPCDGYFYHPQWGKDISVSRRGRDAGWSIQAINAYGEKPDYPTAYDRLASSDKEERAALPEHLTSLEAFCEYLNTFDLENRSYWSGNMLQSQIGQIKSAGEEYKNELFRHLGEKQREDNGLWEPRVNYASANGLMKLTLIYSSCDQPIPNAVAALKSALQAAMSDEEITFCCQFYNPIITIANILDNIKKYGSQELSDSLRSGIKENAAELIRRTREKVLLCKKPDGVFGYKVVGGICHSQQAPVATGVNESDVNASSISCGGVLYNLARVLDIPMPFVFGTEDSRLFYELIENATVMPKTAPKPDFVK